MPRLLVTFQRGIDTAGMDATIREHGHTPEEHDGRGQRIAYIDPKTTQYEKLTDALYALAKGAGVQTVKYHEA